jgi:hypothetical protein
VEFGIDHQVPFAVENTVSLSQYGKKTGEIMEDNDQHGGQLE